MSTKEPFEVVCCMMSWDSSVYNHLMPVALHPRVTKLWIVRSHKSEFGDILNAQYVLTPAENKPLKWLKINRACVNLAARDEVKAFVTFNPIPYGLLAYHGAKKFNKPIHLGFIGADWNKYSQGIGKQFFMNCYRKTDFITVTGHPMKQEMINQGLDGNKIEILPHPIDLDRFPLNQTENTKYSCVFIGELIHRKRVDIILEAFAKVVKSQPESKLCIVGDGPLKPALMQQAETLGIAHLVDFQGFQSNVQPYLQAAKILVIASESEGFPFSMVEGICCGLIPITTPVGTICDHITNNVNGLIFPTNDVDALANRITSILTDDKLYSQIKEGVLKLRDNFSYSKATEIWDKWFSTM